MLAEDGGVLACGDDSWGQLGTGGGNSLKLKPTEIEWFSENMVRVIQIEAGLEHSLFLSSDKQVFLITITHRSTRVETISSISVA